METKIPQCLLYLLPEGVNRPDLKRLQVIGSSVGPEGTLLDQPQTVDATDRKVAVKGKARTKDGTPKDVTIQPAQYAASCQASDLNLYEDINNGGDALCLVAPYAGCRIDELVYWPTWGSPAGWHDQASSYESIYRRYRMFLHVDPNQTGSFMNVPWAYPWAQTWIDGAGVPGVPPYTWNDRLSSICFTGFYSSC